jgi:hypothetical protein
MEKQHTVTVQQINAWANAELWRIAASSWGAGSDKKLELSNAGLYRVRNNGEVTYIGDDISEAVYAYNTAP